MHPCIHHSQGIVMWGANWWFWLLSSEVQIFLCVFAWSVTDKCHVLYILPVNGASHHIKAANPQFVWYESSAVETYYYRSWANQ